MAFRVTVYSFRKKENSTKRVTPQNALENTQMDCQLKTNGSGIVAPTMIINYGLEKAPVNYNYAYVPNWKRYYFITDWNFTDGLWEGHFTEDFLATWKTLILDSTQYVLRSANLWNKAVRDEMYPAVATISVNSRQVENPFNVSNITGYNGGTYIVGIVCDFGIPKYSHGGVTYYVMDASVMAKFSELLMKDVDWTKIDWTGDAKKFLTEDLLKTLFNPIQYVASCIWYPDFSADKGTPVPTIKVGYWTLDLQGCRVLDSYDCTDTWVFEIDIPKHPQSERGQYLNLAPYTTYQLHFPPYGLIDVPADEILNSSNLAVELVQDYVTGNARIMVAAPNVRFVEMVNFQLGVTMQISQIVQSLIGTAIGGVSSVMEGAAGAAKLGGNSKAPLGIYSPFTETVLPLPNIAGAVNSFSGFIQSMSSAIGDVSSAVTSTVQSVGTNGARAWFFTGETFIRLSGKFVLVADSTPETCGNPVMRRHKLTECNGFTLCKDASIEIEGNRTEQQMVNAYLNSGFYIE